MGQAIAQLTGGGSASGTAPNALPSSYASVVYNTTNGTWSVTGETAVNSDDPLYPNLATISIRVTFSDQGIAPVSQEAERFNVPWGHNPNTGNFNLQIAPGSWSMLLSVLSQICYVQFVCIDTNGLVTANPFTVALPVTIDGASLIGTISASLISGTIVAGVIGSISASAVTGGITASQIVSVNASVITGTISASQIGSINASVVNGGIQASQISSVYASTAGSPRVRLPRLVRASSTDR
jgi:hypothetical protein